MQQVMNKAESNAMMERARLMPGVAHMPGFGLVGGDLNKWNMHDPELEKKAADILNAEGITFTSIDETPPALFWYVDLQGEKRCHHWEIGG